MDDIKQSGQHPVSVSVNSSDLEKLSQRTIFFGHQSVGFNILEGVTEILGEHKNIKLDIVESKDFGSATRFYHSRVGQNGDPVSKIQDFTSMIDGGIGKQADIAFFKLCYVDFRSSTDAEAVFQIYRQSMEKLQQSYPDVRFVHVTTPLTIREKGIKTIIKGIIGRARWGYEDNQTREIFNQLIRKEYGQAGLVFDLARLESTLPDGSRLEYEHGGEEYYALVPAYSSDGGHLNEIGRRYIAGNLLNFLASIE